MKRIIIVPVFVLINICLLFAQNDTDTVVYNRKSYRFIFQDSPANLFTMRQFNQNYLSGYRCISNYLNKKMNTKTIHIIEELSDILFFYPLTHEEGHRSILTSLGIGSISQPYFNSEGAAYVKGVRDLDLQNLRQYDLPNYIRLHTAGLESDYMVSNRIEELVLFNQESKRNLFYGYFVRTLGLISYYTLSMYPSLNPQLKEEPNELDRDVVGHDVYGAIKNLYRPHETFYRYTNYNDLTSVEKQFVKRVGYRALLNLASPLFFKPLNLVRKQHLTLSLGLGYTMCPFGDFIDEKIYIQVHNNYRFRVYLRQFENYNTWFMGGGLCLVDYQISPKLNTTIGGHLWSQPKKLDFKTTQSQFGGSADVVFKYTVSENKSHNSISLDIGLLYKTFGFLPEEVILKQHFGVSLGATVNLIQK